MLFQQISGFNSQNLGKFHLLRDLRETGAHFEKIQQEALHPRRRKAVGSRSLKVCGFVDVHEAIFYFEHKG